jgi:protein ATS1
MLYAFGSNGSAQLGVGHADDLSTPTSIQVATQQALWKVKQLAAGGNHTVLLCDDGAVHVAGNNEDGRCGIEDRQQLAQFHELQLPLINGTPLAVKKVSANWATTTILGDNGDVYVCGNEAHLRARTTNAPSLQRIAVFPLLGANVVDIASGMGHTVAVLSNGDVYGWGKGRKGQLGEPAEDVLEPRKVNGIKFKVVKAVCGKDFTCVLGAPSKGQMMLLGPNGTDRFRVRADAPSPLRGYTDVVASWGSIYALMASGHVIAWGRDDHGQLPPLSLAEVEKIAAGSEHCLALTKAGQVLAWGWGEHGNCGKSTDEHGDVREPPNEIEVAGRVTGLFAGCATSFIQTDGE